MVDLVDMKFFVRSVACGSLSAAGRELGFSPAVASKRLTRMEAELGVRLLQRNSRRLAVTEEGALYEERCKQILADVEDAENFLDRRKQKATGSLHISCPVALGRRVIGDAVAAFANEWPELRVRLSLSDSIIDLVDENFDCAIRIGGAEDSRLIARKLADNYRVICASPSYINSRGSPATLDDLVNHHAINLSSQLTDRVNWRLLHTTSHEVGIAQLPARMATNNGEQAHDWALAGMGLVFRSLWDVKGELERGELIHLLPEWQGEASPIRIVFPSRQFLPARTRLFIDYLVNFFELRTG